ncbi:MAG: hypothetical protein KGI35_15470, partial [Burkholderiales bacterium]|nr:hypothetical protein [Burkholderiales bacterium]
MAAGRLRLTLYRKFLLVLVPSFVVLAAAGVVLAGRLDTRSATEALALRVGSLAACVAATLGRHDALGERGLAEDLLGTFGTDRAVLCAELRARDDAEPA